MNNREIKFRAWDNGTMVNDLSLTDFGNEQLQDRLHTYPPLELMLSTGRKDKNGKEIYEGDIISKDGWVGVVQFSEFVLAWMYDRPQKKTGNTDNYLYLVSSKCEIIGNIYSNPELLK